jgi:hypothetical protein
MIGLSELAISVSAAARGIAEADSVGIAANAQAATPTNNNRFILEILLVAAGRDYGGECFLRLQSSILKSSRCNKGYWGGQRRNGSCSRLWSAWDQGRQRNLVMATRCKSTASDEMAASACTPVLGPFPFEARLFRRPAALRKA